MTKVSMIGVDLAKNVFQLHGIDAAGKVVLRRQLRRAEMEKFFAKLPPGVVIGMEACGGAHHWARVAQKHGHETRIMPAAYVKPYVKRNKNDGRDAEGVCEAMGRPTMRFVAVKSLESQAALALHRHASAFGSSADHDGECVSLGTGGVWHRGGAGLAGIAQPP